MDRTELMQSLVDQYAAAKTQQQRAVIEERVWEAATAEARVAVKRTQWVLQHLPAAVGGGYETELRHRVLRAPQELWDRINMNQLSLRSAMKCWHEARFLSRRDGGSAAAKVAGLLVHYDKTGVFTGSAPAPSTAAPATGAPRVDNERWRAPAGRLQACVVDFVGTQLKGRPVSDYDRDDLIGQLEREIQTAIRAFSVRLARLGSTDAPKGITRRQVLDACRTLRIDPPKPEAQVDLAAARRNKKQLARAYHPDTSKADNARVFYQQVIEAFDVLEQYHKQVVQK